MSKTIKIKNCPVCDSSEFLPYKEVKDWLVSKEVYSISSCVKCGFRFTSNAPTQDLIGPYYDSEEYVEHSDTNSGLIYSLYHTARKWMLKYKYRKIKKFVTGKNLLDVGSGSGYFMNFMKSNGFNVTGVEISQKAVDLCKKNFDITAKPPSDLLEGKLEENYNLITLWHVFEHVYQYEQYFDFFQKSLSPNGTLVLALPNSDSTDANIYGEHWAAYDVPRHLWHFTPETLEKFAVKNGFTLYKKIRMPLDPFFISMVSASYKKSFTFLPITLLIASYSFVKSLINIKKCSSLIYILKRASI